jgi:hypothetical protein
MYFLNIILNKSQKNCREILFPAKGTDRNLCLAVENWFEKDGNIK